MTLLSASNLQTNEIVEASFLAQASYDGTPISPWRALSSTEINFQEGVLNGSFTGTMDGTRFQTGIQFSVSGLFSSYSGIAQVYRAGDRLAISFSSTDHINDYFEYTELFFGEYIKAFEYFLETVANYAAQQGILSTNILVTGHSLGAVQQMKCEKIRALQMVFLLIQNILPLRRP